MIKENEIEIEIKTVKRAKLYNSLYGEQPSIGQIVKWPVKDLSKGSHALITGICDKCGAEKVMAYKTYVLITHDGTTPYYCHKHITERIGERYGVKNIFQLENIKEKSRQTSLAKYGVPYYTQTEEYKEQYLYGENNYFYRKDGKETDLRYENTTELKQWRQAIYDKYNRTCVICGQKHNSQNIIEAHHLWGYFDFPDKIYDVENGVTLCKHHHRQFHWLYKDQVITPDLFQEYIQGLTTISKESTVDDELPLEVHSSRKVEDIV